MEYRELHYADAPDAAVTVDLGGLNHKQHRLRIADLLNEAGRAGISVHQTWRIDLKPHKIRHRVITSRSEMAADIR